MRAEPLKCLCSNASRSWVSALDHLTQLFNRILDFVLRN